MAIRQIAADGIRPALWKIEGPESRDDAARIAAAVRSADPAPAASSSAAAPTPPRYGAGWPLRRRPLASPGSPRPTIWWDALHGFTGGGDRDTAVRAVAARYLDLVRYYQAVSPAT